MLSIPKSEWKKVITYYEKGLSMREIAENLSVSIGAVTYVLRKTQTKRRDRVEARKAEFNRKAPSFTIKKIDSLSKKELQAFGIALYWAEGYKTGSASGVDFTNSDPAMVIVFMRFLRMRYTFDTTRIRILLYCYKNQDVKNVMNYWSKLLEVPLSQFSKPYIKTGSESPKKTMRYGVVHIRYNDKKMLIDILNLIHSYTQKHCVGTQAVNEDAL